MLQLISDLIFPIALLVTSAVYAVLTLVQSLVNRDIQTLTSLRTFKSKSFANLWRSLGDLSYQKGRPNVAPLLPRAKGKVLDIGTGTGHWLEFYDRTKLTKLYCVEPNEGQHAGLWQKARACGLHEVLEVITAPVESLRAAGIEKGSIDTVVTIQVLCSVPEPDTMAKELYTYLKPGGHWITFEHVRTPTNGLISQYQAILNVIWPSMLDGCSLRRDTSKYIMDAGRWSSSTLRAPPGESTTTVVPHVEGILKK